MAVTNMTKKVAKVMPNRFAGYCTVSKERVAPGDGFVVQYDGDPKWYTFSKAHVPVRMGTDKGKPIVRRLSADGRITMPFDQNALPLLRSIPGARWDKPSLSWQVSLAEGDRMRLLEVADQLKLEVAPELRNITLSEQAQNATHAGLYPFQVTGVEFLAKGDKRLLADDMGLGKTVQTLVALAADEPALAIVPAAVKYNWRDEAKVWNPKLKVTVLEGRESFRLPNPGELVITNYDILPDWLVPVEPFKGAKPWEYRPQLAAGDEQKIKGTTIIIDEAQRVKNYKTGRSRKVKGLTMIAKKVIALTGTPLENRPPDLFGVLESLSMVGQVFGNWKRFVDLMGGMKDRWGGYSWGRPKPEVPQLMRRVMLRRTRDEVLPDLPRKTYTTVKVDVPANLRHQLDKMWEDYEELLGDDVPMEKRKLPPFEEFSKIRAQLAASRIDAITDMVDEAEEDGVPLVVFSAHLEPLNKLAEREGWAKITGDTPAAKRTEIVRRFQAGELKGVACSIKAAGIGLTLTRAWKMIFVDMDWVPGANFQAEDRIARIGQKAKKVEIVRLVSDHVLDIHILNLIAWKISIIDKAINGMTAEFAVDKVESETEFAARMAQAEAATIGVTAEAVVEKTVWPVIKRDPGIPF